MSLSLDSVPKCQPRASFSSFLSPQLSKHSGCMQDCCIFTLPLWEFTVEAIEALRDCPGSYGQRQDKKLGLHALLPHDNKLGCSEVLALVSSPPGILSRSGDRSLYARLHEASISEPQGMGEPISGWGLCSVFKASKVSLGESTPFKPPVTCGTLTGCRHTTFLSYLGTG